MPRRRISSDSKFEALASYSRAIVDDDWIFVSGTVGTDPASGEIPEFAAAQANFALATIETALRAGGGTLADIVHYRLYVVDQAALAEVIPVVAARFRDIRPANTTLICGIPAPGAKVEIEAIARRIADRPGPAT